MPFEQHITAADEELINGLQQKSLQKRKAEEELFKRYVYLIKKGMSKYSLTEEEVFDAYSDTILYGINSISNGVFKKKSSLKLTSTEYLFVNVLTLSEKKRPIRIAFTRQIP